MEGKEHTDEPHSILLPTENYEKQVNIYRDDNNKIYIKPNEFLGKVDLEENKYKLRLYFLRDIKSRLSEYLQQSKITEKPILPRKKADMKLIPIYRFWNEEEQKHHYTTNQEEYENLIPYGNIVCHRLY